MAAKKKVRVEGCPVLWDPFDNYTFLFALVIILGGFFLAVKSAQESNDVLGQITGGLFTLTGFVLTRLLKLVSRR